MKTLLAGSAAALVLGVSIFAGAGTRSAPPLDVPFAADTDALLKKCKACHGEDLTGKGKTKGIAGMSKDAVMKALTTATPKPMAAVVKALSDADKTAIADAVAKLPKGSK